MTKKKKRLWPVLVIGGLIISFPVIVFYLVFSPAQELDRLVDIVAGEEPGPIDSLLVKYELKIPYSSSQAESEMKELAPSVVPELIEALDDPRKPVRECAAGALGHAQDPRALEALIRTVEGGQNTSAAYAIGNYRDPRVCPALIKALASRDSGVRAAAARTLLDVGDARCSAPLISVLNDQNQDVREYAVMALEKHPDKRAVKPLIARLQDPISLSWSAPSRP